MRSHSHFWISCIAIPGCLFLASSALSQQTPPANDRIIGVWLTADAKAHVEIYKEGDKYSGKIVWLKEPEKDGKPAVDDQNPEERLRTRPIMDLEIMTGFAYDGDGVWTGGRVYDPESGNEYRGKLELKDENTMELRGYVLIPLFGRTETWTRVN